MHGDTVIDRFRAGLGGRLTKAERAGLWIYESKGACWKCHSGPNFADDEFHNTGIGVVAGKPRPGRMGITGDAADAGRFKTPTLRALTETGPYMHDGSIRTLEEVVAFYRRGGNANSGLILLAAVLTVLCVSVSWTAIRTRVPEFYAALLVAETAMIGLFAAANLFLFFIFWELMVVPLFLLIGVWGGPARIQAAVKFLLFTLSGSVLMLVGMIALYNEFGTLDFRELAAATLQPKLQTWLFVAFLAAFAVKVPSKAAIKLILVKRSANDPKRPSPLTRAEALVGTSPKEVS